jgi:hypothetical protein
MNSSIDVASPAGRLILGLEIGTPRTNESIEIRYLVASSLIIVLDVLDERNKQLDPRLTD